MNEDDFPKPDVAVDSITPTDLRERMDAGEDVFVLDTRARSEFEQWHIEGDSVEIVNVPYFEFLVDEGDEDLYGDLPTERTITVLCAKGGASEYVAGLLTERGYDTEHLAEGMNGWAAIYESVEVTRYDGAGTLYQYQLPSSGCLGYLLVAGGTAAVIDPLRVFADRYLADATASGAELEYAIDTHVHADHVSGVRTLAERDTEGVVPEAAADRGITYTDEVSLLADGDTLTVGDATIEAVYTPGHTSGMTSYLIDGSFLATGDTLFTESVARPDLEEGDAGAPTAARRLHESLRERLLTHGDDVVIGGAHYGPGAEPATDGTYTARIGDLEERMDALAMNEAEFVELILADMPPRPANYEEIIATNLGREEVTDEKAFSLELGPNNCAASQDALTSDPSA